MKICGIYEITCAGNGKRYIGSSVSIAARWSRHIRELKKTRHANPKLQHAWAKYGESAFTFVVLMECPRNELLFWESWFIQEAAPNSFNIAKDALAPMMGRTHTAETRAKMSASSPRRTPTQAERDNLRVKAIGRPANDNQRAAVSASNRTRQVTEATRKAMSKANIGRVKSDAERANISAALRARFADPLVRAQMAESLRGRKLTAEHKANISKGGKGIKKSPETIARMRAAAALRDPARYEKTAASLRGRPKSEAHRTALSVAGKLRYERERGV